MMQPIIFIGSGLAAYSVARAVRKLNSEVPLCMITQDNGHFYSKPTLSNALAQKKLPEQLITTPASLMTSQVNMGLHTETRVMSLDTINKQVQTNHGNFSYSQLVLALGADPVRLSLQGNAASEVLSVNDLSDYTRFRDRLEGAKYVAIIGAGLIGCEFANDLVHHGVTPVVFDPSAYPLSNLLPEKAARDLIEPLQQAGVQWRFGQSVQAVDKDDAGYKLTLSTGDSVRVDLVLSAVGLRPRSGIAKAAGLTVNLGIVVDRYAQTSAPDVYAIGDCAEYPAGVMPYVMPIMNVSKALAQTLVGQKTAYEFPAMPVSIKTPACPVAVQPVARDQEGKWELIGEQDGVKMIFKDMQSKTCGFVLTGKKVTERLAMTKMLGS